MESFVPNLTTCFVFEASAGKNAGYRWASDRFDSFAFFCLFFFFLLRTGEGRAERFGSKSRSKEDGGRGQKARKKATLVWVFGVKIALDFSSWAGGFMGVVIGFGAGCAVGCSPLGRYDEGTKAEDFKDEFGVNVGRGCSFTGQNAGEIKTDVVKDDFEANVRRACLFSGILAGRIEAKGGMVEFWAVVVHACSFFGILVGESIARDGMIGFKVSCVDDCFSLGTLA